MKLPTPPLMDDINEQIATRVMGMPAQPWSNQVCCPYCGNRGRYCGARSWCNRCMEWYSSAYKHYQDSIEDAMEVVEKMREQNYSVLIRSATQNWYVEFNPRGGVRAHSRQVIAQSNLPRRTKSD